MTMGKQDPESLNYLDMQQVSDAEFNQLKDSLQQSSHVNRSADGHIDVYAQCPYCGYPMCATASPIEAIGAPSFGLQVPGRGPEEEQVEPQPVPLVTVLITCECHHNHPGRAEEITSGCGFSAEVPV